MDECRNRLLVNVDTEAILNVKSENILYETFDLNRVIHFPDELKSAQPEEWTKWKEENWGTNRNCVYNTPRAVWSKVNSYQTVGPEPRIWKMLDWRRSHLFSIEFYTANEPPTKAVKHLARMNPESFILQEYSSNYSGRGAYLYANGDLKLGTLDNSSRRPDLTSVWLNVDFKSEWLKFSDL